jgi:hypothetical protein
VSFFQHVAQFRKQGTRQQSFGNTHTWKQLAPRPAFSSPGGDGLTAWHRFDQEDYMKIRYTLSLLLLVMSLLLSPSNTLIGLGHLQTVASRMEMQAGSSEGLPGPAIITATPPLSFPTGSWPGYAEEEIYVSPEPPVPGIPAEICAVVVNSDGGAVHTASLEFSKAQLGIGIPYMLIGTAEFDVPAGSHAVGCMEWLNPDAGDVGIQVNLLQAGYTPQTSQRNVEVRELLQPGLPNDLIFPVRNPLPGSATITLGLIPHLPGWSIALSEDVLTSMASGEIRPVTLTVTPPAAEDLPPDYTPIVDIEGYSGLQLIGGFRKIFRPPVALHTLPDPTYAEREISINPYPLEAGRPTEVCAELYNPTANPREVLVHFSAGAFGIGILFTELGSPHTVDLAAFSVKRECIFWVPPITANACLQVTLEQAGYAPQYSQRNIAIARGLLPGIPYELTFVVRNPLGSTETVTLGMIPYLNGWSYELSEDVLSNMLGGEIRPVTLTITPPAGQGLPEDFTPLLDVEGFIGSNPIGGIETVYEPAPLFQNFLPMVSR